MTYLTLDSIRKHLNLDATFHDDDSYLTMLGGVVEECVEKHIDDSFEELAEANGGQLPFSLRQACLLLLGTYYANRESVAFASNSEVEHTFTYIVDLWRNYSGIGADAQSILKELAERIEKLEAKKLQAGNLINLTTPNSATTVVNVVEEIDEGTY